MKRTPRAHKRNVKALRDPKPNYVSLVKTGANMTPFLSVKAAQGSTHQEAFMGIKQHDIAKIVFKTEKFADEASVNELLTAGGYEGFSVVKTEEGFEVTNADAEFAETTAVEADGLTVFVGKVAEEAEKSEEDQLADKAAEAPAVVALKEEAEEPAAKAEEVAVEEPAAKAEEVPVEEAQVEETVEKAEDETVAQKNMGAAYELTYMLKSLKWLADDADYVGLDDADVATIKSSAGALVAVVSKLAQNTIDGLNEAFKAAKIEDIVLPVNEAKSEEVAGEQIAPLSEDPTIKALVDSVNALTAKVAELTEAKEAAKAEAQAEEERVRSLEAEQRQTRKSADTADEPEEVQKEKKTSDSEYVDELRLRSALGF